MPTRKQTPDILAEVMEGISAPDTEAEQVMSIPPSKPKARKAPAKKAPAKTTSPKNAPVKADTPPASTPVAKPNRWEYRLVSFQNYQGWRPRYVDGSELPHWMEQPRMEVYLRKMGEQGWELTAASSGDCLYGVNDRHQLFFKRPVS